MRRRWSALNRATAARPLKARLAQNLQTRTEILATADAAACYNGGGIGVTRLSALIVFVGDFSS
jgi:hypothetical protein